ncbi:MAG: BrnA antitoxin family protein [Betaproteobacteria bacterium]
MRKEYDFSKGKRGAVMASPGKTRITIMLDDDVIEHFRARAEAAGTGYQTAINAALRTAMGVAPGRADDTPLTVATLRKVLREELKAA